MNFSDELDLPFFPFLVFFWFFVVRSLSSTLVYLFFIYVDSIVPSDTINMFRFEKKKMGETRISFLFFSAGLGGKKNL